MTLYYIITQEGREYIKEIDYAKGKLSFTKNETEAYKGRDGYYASATQDMISRGFKDAYPQVENLQRETKFFS